MSQFSWESEVLEQAQPEERLTPVRDALAEQGTVALSTDDFAALEDRVLRAVNLVKRERITRAEAEERAMQAEARLAEHAPLVERLESELAMLRAERDHVRQRVERLLAQLDTLEL